MYSLFTVIIISDDRWGDFSSSLSDLRVPEHFAIRIGTVLYVHMYDRFDFYFNKHYLFPKFASVITKTGDRFNVHQINVTRLQHCGLNPLLSEQALHFCRLIYYLFFLCHGTQSQSFNKNPLCRMNQEDLRNAAALLNCLGLSVSARTITLACISGWQ